MNQLINVYTYLVVFLLPFYSFSQDKDTVLFEMLNSDFELVYDIDSVPSEVIDSINLKGYMVVGVGEKYNSTDLYVKNMSNSRLIFYGESRKNKNLYCMLIEAGGYSIHNVAFIGIKNEPVNKFFLFSGISNIEELKQALRKEY